MICRRLQLSNRKLYVGNALGYFEILYGVSSRYKGKVLAIKFSKTCTNQNADNVETCLNWTNLMVPQRKSKTCC